MIEVGRHRRITRCRMVGLLAVNERIAEILADLNEAANVVLAVVDPGSGKVATQSQAMPRRENLVQLVEIGSVAHEVDLRETEPYRRRDNPAAVHLAKLVWSKLREVSAQAAMPVPCDWPTSDFADHDGVGVNGLNVVAYQVGQQQ